MEYFNRQCFSKQHLNIQIISMNMIKFYFKLVNLVLLSKYVPIIKQTGVSNILFIHVKRDL